MSSRARTTRPTGERRTHRNNGDLSQQQQKKKNSTLVKLVESWVTEDSQRDPQEVQAEWEEFREALDADRLSDRKLFP